MLLNCVIIVIRITNVFMAYSSPGEFKETQDDGEMNELLPGKKTVITSAELTEQQQLDVMIEASGLMYSLWPNPSGNKNERTFTLELANGAKALVPVPLPLGLGARLGIDFIDVHGNITLSPAKDSGRLHFVVQNLQRQSVERHRFQKVETGGETEPGSPITGKIWGQKIALASHREVGMGKRALLFLNEDNAGFNDRFVVIADGVSGNGNGSQISSAAVEAFLKYPGKDFREVVFATHQRVKEFLHLFINLVLFKAKQKKAALGQHSSAVQSSDSGEFYVPDTTLVAAGMEGNVLHTVVLGDSILYILRKDGLLEHTKLHHEDNTSTLTSSLVYPPFFKPDFRDFPVRDGDRILLCSDGADTDRAMIVRCLKNAATPQEAVEKLREAKTEENLLHGMGDNFTAAAVF